MQSALYYARRPGWDYPPHMDLDFGQVVELNPEFPKNGRVIDLGMLAKVDRGSTLPQCGRCGRAFVSDADLSRHGRKRHATKPPLPTADTPEQEKLVEAIEEHRVCQTAEAEQREADRRAPLHMDKTKASRASGAGAPEIATKPDNKRRAGPAKKRRRAKTARKRAARR